MELALKEQDDKYALKNLRGPLLNDYKYDNLVLNQTYEKSYMHKDVLNHIISLPKSNFIITASKDGIVKFWRKIFLGIDYVKQYKVFNSSIKDIKCSNNQNYLICISELDKNIKLLDVLNYDLCNIININFKPSKCCFLSKEEDNQLFIGVSVENKINIFEAFGSNNNIIKTLIYHDYDISNFTYSFKYECLISSDIKGGIEISEINNHIIGEKVKHEKFNKNDNSNSNEIIKDFEIPSKVKFQLKSETDLYIFESKDDNTNDSRDSTLNTKGENSVYNQYCKNIFLSHSNKYFAIVSNKNHILIFKTNTCKLQSLVNESYKNFLNQNLNKKNNENNKKGDMGNYSSLNTLLQKIDVNKNDNKTFIEEFVSNVEFDEYDTYIYYCSFAGVKIYNFHTKKLIKSIATKETIFITAVSLFQGEALSNFQGAVGEGSNTSQSKLKDPTLFAIAHNSNRFYLFTQRETNKNTNRDIINEEPKKNDLSLTKNLEADSLPTLAVLETTYGEIYLRLFPNECPKTVKNFVELAKKDYYKNLIFHRVIKGFIIQTGCPYGNGKGGTSVWGRDFEDEFSPLLKHDRAYTLSMANKGPNTNGSQFFITTAPTPWLDNKHTVFGRVYKGIDAVQNIESVECDSMDKPIKDVKLKNIRLV